MTRRAGMVAAALLILGGGLVWWLLHRSPGGPVWQGYAEADFVKVGPVQQGLLTEVSVARGDLVAAGAPLFAQDETPDRAARDQAARQLQEAQDQLADLEAGGKETEIQQAEANLADAKATLTRAEADLKRGDILVRSGAVSIKSVDQLRADHDSAAARVDSAQAALDQLLKPLGRRAQIQAQRASVDAARAAVDMIQWRLDQRRVRAPAAGRVADVLARPGETMAAGMPVISLLPPQNIFVRFFVPEAARSSVHRGDRVTLSCDGCPAGLSGEISFIAPQAEYTPPVIYSEESRSKLVFLIEARPPPEQATQLDPGQPVEVRPAAKATPS